MDQDAADRQLTSRELIAALSQRVRELRQSETWLTTEVVELRTQLRAAHRRVHALERLIQ